MSGVETLEMMAGGVDGIGIDCANERIAGEEMGGVAVLL